MDRRSYPSLGRLRALQAVSEEGSFSLAAGRLRLTQPAVSAQIRQLETECGVPLVERLGKTAAPTHAGRLLLAAAARVFAELDQALDAIGALRGAIAGPLRIGAGGTATTYLLPPKLARLEKAHPQLALSVATGNTPAMVDAILAGTLDIAVVTAPVIERRIAQIDYFEDRLVCIAPTAEVRERRSVRPEDLAGRTLVLYGPGGLIRMAIDAWLARAAGPVPRRIDVESAEAQKSFVEAGLGWAIVSEMAVAGEPRSRSYRIVPLAPPLARRLILVWRQDRADNPLVAAAREALLAQSGDSH